MGAVSSRLSYESGQPRLLTRAAVVFRDLFSSDAVNQHPTNLLAN